MPSEVLLVSVERSWSGYMSVLTPKKDITTEFQCVMFYYAQGMGTR